MKDIFLFKKENNDNDWDVVYRPLSERDVQMNIMLLNGDGIDFSDLGEYAKNHGHEIRPEDVIDMKELIDVIKSNSQNDIYYELGDKDEINLIIESNNLEIYYQEMQIELKLTSKDYQRSIDIYEVGDKTLKNASYVRFVHDTIHNGIWFKFFEKEGREWLYVKSPYVENKEFDYVLYLADDILK